jgi:hypothetical protein
MTRDDISKMIAAREGLEVTTIKTIDREAVVKAIEVSGKGNPLFVRFEIEPSDDGRWRFDIYTKPSV